MMRIQLATIVLAFLVLAACVQTIPEEDQVPWKNAHDETTSETMPVSVIVTNPVTDGRALFRFVASDLLAHIRIEIYTIIGERARALDVRILTPSAMSVKRVTYDLPYDCRNESGRALATGIYICAFNAAFSDGNAFRLPPIKLALIRSVDRSIPGDTLAEKTVLQIQPNSADPREVEAAEFFNVLLGQLPLARDASDVMAEIILLECDDLMKKYSETHAAVEAQLALFSWDMLHGRQESSSARLRAIEKSPYQDVRARGEDLRRLLQQQSDD